jgi:uncharacterized protein
MKLGLAHEEWQLQQYHAQFPSGVVDVMEGTEPWQFSREELRGRASQTLDALQAQVPVVYQGVCLTDSFVGFADFMVLDKDGTYRIQDTKLARAAKGGALIQLAAYADQFQRLGVPVHPDIEVIVGTRETVAVPLDVVNPVYHARRDRLQELLRVDVGGVKFDAADSDAVAFGAEQYSACRRCDECREAMAEAQDLMTVAGVTAGRRRMLMASGVRTVEELIAATVTPEGMPARVFEALRAQARVQHESVPGEVPVVEVVSDDPAALLPQPTPDDLYLTLWQDPLYSENGGKDWGLMFLAGFVDGNSAVDVSGIAGGQGAGAGTTEAHFSGSLSEEFSTFVGLVDLLWRRWARTPTFHVYHYGPEVPAQLRALAGRHGERIDHVEAMLRDGVFLDLRLITRKAALIGVEEYSLGSIEPVYLTDVHDGISDDPAPGDRWAEALLPENRDQRAEMLAALKGRLAYRNTSLRNLGSWIRGLEARKAVASVDPSVLATETAPPPPWYDAPEEGTRRARLVQRLMRWSAVLAGTARGSGGSLDAHGGQDAHSGQDADGGQDVHGGQCEQGTQNAQGTQDARALAMAAAAVEYFPREERLYRANFEYLRGLSVEELAGVRNVFVMDQAQSGDSARPRSTANPSSPAQSGGTAQSGGIALPSSPVQPGQWEDLKRGFSHATSRGRRLTLSGRWSPGSTYSEGASSTDVRVLYRDGAIRGMRPRNDLAPYTDAQLTHVAVGPHQDAVTFTEWQSGNDRLDYQAMPVALVEGPPVDCRKLGDAVVRWAEALADHLDRTGGNLQTAPPNIMLDVLRRIPPRLGSGGRAEVQMTRPANPSVTGRGDPVTTDPGGTAPNLSEPDTVSAIVESLVTMTQKSYLAVQGPPGTGKTYTAGHVMARLVSEYRWRIGVTSQSHAGISNALTATHEAGLRTEYIAKALRFSEQRDPAVLYPHTVVGHAADGADMTLDAFQRMNTHSGYVFGGTAWSFASQRRGQVPVEWDLLVIDEAGQFSLPSTIAAVGRAKRVLFLGDPQQLPQVSQAEHPGEIATAALRWISVNDTGDPADVLPDRLGYFLAETRRMDAALTAKVSALSYGGQLHTHSVTGTRALLPTQDHHGIAPGVHGVPVPHRGNASSSKEEAEAVVRCVISLMGTPWNDGHRVRPLDAWDFMVITPYNAQRIEVEEHLAAADLSDVPVGTVDKFQGQESVIAILTMAASDASEIPRGMEFLLNRNRLNVGISRAQWAALVVYSPYLMDHVPYDAERLRELSAFISLVSPDTP